MESEFETLIKSSLNQIELAVTQVVDAILVSHEKGNGGIRDINYDKELLIAKIKAETGVSNE
jgi:hypothetical protein